MRYVRLAMITAVIVVLLPRLSLADVGCPFADRNTNFQQASSAIVQTGAASVTISSTTVIEHLFDHPNCSGVLWAKPFLIGGITGCTTTGGLNHTSGPTSSRTTQLDCNNLRRGVFITRAANIGGILTKTTYSRYSCASCWSPFVSYDFNSITPPSRVN